jgi:hypothetical protein
MPETQVVQDVGDVAPRTAPETTPDPNGDKLMPVLYASKLMGATFVMTLSFSDWLFNASQEQGERFEQRFPSPVDFFRHMAPWIAESVSSDQQPMQIFQDRFKALIAEIEKD